MTTKKMIDRLSIANEYDWDSRPYLQFLKALASKTKDINEVIDKVLNARDGSQLSNAKVSIEQSLKNTMRGNNVPSMRGAIEDFNQVLIDFEHMFGPGPAVNELRLRGTEHFDLLEKAIRSETPTDYLRVIQQSDSLLTRIVHTLRTTKSVLGQIHRPLLPDGYVEIRVVVDSERNLAVFIDNMKIVLDVYNKLCELSGISIESDPALLHSVEYGCADFDIFGCKVVVEFIRDTLKFAGNAIRVRTTFDGRMERLVSQSDMVKKLIAYEKTLKKEGYDNSNLREGIQDHAEYLSSNLDQLLKDTKSIKVDNLLFESPDLKSTSRLGRAAFQLPEVIIIEDSEEQETDIEN